MSDVGVDTSRVEAPVTWKTYMMCAFAAFGGIFFGYDSGYISGVMAMDYFITEFEGLDKATTPADLFVIPSWKKSLITSILSAGTFFGALIAGDLSDWFGRRTTIVAGCAIFIVGVVLQTASAATALLVVGRLIAGFGVGFVSAIIILYMSEIAPRKVRGAIVSGYQFCITIGLMLASCVDYATQNRTDSGSYRIPIGVQIAWALILGAGLLLLPESPRYFVKKGDLTRAAEALGRVRDQPRDSELIRSELAEIVANHEYEMQAIPQSGYFGSWFNCFRGSLWNPNSNLRRTVLGTSLQMMQQWTGVNFVFYFGTTFFKSLGTISDPFLISMITTIVNVCSTPISFYTMEKLGRRTLLLWGALGMVVCQFIVAIIIAVITPYMVDTDKGNLKAKVFFIWGSLCACAFVYTYFLIPETKGLTLEQVDKMMEETTPRTSAKWKPHGTFAAEMGLTDKDMAEKTAEVVHQEV
ncbi:hypothetical protein KXV48_002995 [Aspergillus fumigatus]|nr:hypothetical protein KXV48_002995 [Aspergillus fumigatus]